MHSSLLLKLNEINYILCMPIFLYIILHVCKKCFLTAYLLDGGKINIILWSYDGYFPI